MFKLILLIIISKLSCNIWDNMFSQLRSPQFIIPKDFATRLIDSNGEDVFKLLVSSHLNLIKATLMLENTYIMEILLNFNMSTVSIDFPDNCTYTKPKSLKSLTAEFFIKSYDFLTFYRNNTEVQKYEYIFTDLLKGGEDMFLYEERMPIMQLEIL